MQQSRTIQRAYVLINLFSDPSTFFHSILVFSTSTMPQLHILLAMFILFSFLCSSAAADDTDTLTAAGQTLSVGSKLVSRNGKFALGFFQFPPPTASANSTVATKINTCWYLGIWFNKVPLFTTVWIANREDPIADDKRFNLTVHLKVSIDGNLIISGAESVSIWSTDVANRSTATNATTTIATLLNSGNFAVTSSDGVVRWQSFDHPTDVFLPGSKFSRNKVTGSHSHAISRRSLIDPGLGFYSAELDTSGVVLRSRDPSVVYWSWSSAGASPLQTLVVTVMGLIPQTRDLIRPVYVDNEEEEYYMYTSMDESSSPPTFVSLDISGHIQMNIWSPGTKSWQAYTQPADACTPFGTCGPFTVCNGANARMPCDCMSSFSRRSPPDWELGDRTGGCIRDTPLHCGDGGGSKNKTGSTDVFHAIARVTLPYDPQAVDDATSQSECAEACLGSCSCTAYSFSSRCSVWHGGLLSVNMNDGVDNNSEDVLYLRLAAGDSENSSTKTRRKSSAGAVAAASVISAGLLILLLLLILIWRNRFRWCGSSSYEINQGGNGGGIMAFRYTDLVRATKNFSEKLGAGGFGSVYRGVLSDSTSIAVKRLDGFGQGEKQFRAEVSSIGMIQHINLVKLIGFCCEGDQRLLVYEHMENGSLEGHLFKSDVAVLDWSTRYGIALGVARGLTYLHQSCCECIIHCDIKPENVLLDASFAPKVADFGLAVFVGRDFSRILTTARGTKGYLAPEWLSGVAITPKIDVYGFGMVLMEIISGRRNSPVMYTSSSYDLEYFPVQAIRKLRGGDFRSLVDPRLDGEFDLEQAERVCKVACWCIQDNEFNRPVMSEVVRILEGLHDIEMPPMPRLLAAMMEQSDTSSV